MNSAFQFSDGRHYDEPWHTSCLFRKVIRSSFFLHLSFQLDFSSTTNMKRKDCQMLATFLIGKEEWKASPPRLHKFLVLNFDQDSIRIFLQKNLYSRKFINVICFPTYPVFSLWVSNRIVGLRVKLVWLDIT